MARISIPAYLQNKMDQNGPREAKTNKNHAVLPQKKMVAFTALVRNGHFVSGKYSKPCLLRCKPLVAFITLQRNGIFWRGCSENSNSSAEWKRFFKSHPFCTRLSYIFRGVCTGGPANEHFRREVRRFFCKGAETIVKYIEIVLPGLV